MNALDILTDLINNKREISKYNICILSKDQTIENFVEIQEHKKPWHSSNNHAPRIILNQISEKKRKNNLKLLEIQNTKIEGKDSDLMIISENDYGYKFYYYEIS